MDNNSNVTIKEIQLQLLQMFISLDSICRDNDIQYILAEGSALGAVRHKGFIPWDDDLDIIMTRDNMSKLEHVITEKYSDMFFYQSYLTDKYYNIPFDKLRLNNTTYIEAGEEEKLYHQGLFIDIFPADKLPKGRFSTWLINQKFLLHEIILRNDPRDNPIKKCIEKILVGIFGKEKILSILKKSFTKYNCINTNYYSSYYYMLKQKSNKQRKISSDTLFPPLETTFCGVESFIPHDFDKYLTIEYGDYMTPPPHDKQIGAHHGLVDFHTSYTEYIKQNDVKKNI